MLARPDVEVREETHAVDLLRSGGIVVGVSVRTAAGEHEPILAPAVVLATGGIGGLYAHTTNPPEVTGDGLAMAIRAGARIADPEFVQFHPTAMRSTLDPMPLLTEALRGAGAVLVDAGGERFMVGEHPDAELAPRDVVARAIWRRLDAGDDPRLDATDLGDSFPERFPTVHRYAVQAGLDPTASPIPVSPAAHYHMGGVAVDGAGRSSLARAVRRRRGVGHRAARRQPAGEQLAARRAGLRGAGGRRHPPRHPRGDRRHRGAGGRAGVAGDRRCGRRWRSCAG